MQFIKKIPSCDLLSTWTSISCLKQQLFSWLQVFISISCLKQHFMLNTPSTWQIMQYRIISCLRQLFHEKPIYCWHFHVILAINDHLADKSIFNDHLADEHFWWRFNSILPIFTFESYLAWKPLERLCCERETRTYTWILIKTKALQGGV